MDAVSEIGIANSEAMKVADKFASHCRLWGLDPRKTKFFRKISKYKYVLSHMTHPEWTQAERAKYCGISVMTAAKWERTPEVESGIAAVLARYVDQQMPRRKFSAWNVLDEAMRKGRSAEKLDAAKFVLKGTGEVSDKIDVKIGKDPVTEGLQRDRESFERGQISHGGAA